MTTLDMKCIRYLNLFERITGVRTKNCFFYNKFLIFAVPQQFVSMAIGEGGKKIRKINSVLGRRIRVVALPKNIFDARKFISDVVAPVTFKNLEVSPDGIIISASMQSKASLIGRNKTRLEELSKIVKELFGKELRIV